MNVCIVDDNPLTGAQLAHVLRHEGVSDVRNFTDPALALAHCANHRPDLILVDYNMPVMDGLEFVDRLTRLRPAVQASPVAMITGWAVQGLRDRAQAAGVIEIMEKPVHSEQVLGTLRSLLRRLAEPGETPVTATWIETTPHAAALEEHYLDCLVEIAVRQEPLGRSHAMRVAAVSSVLARGIGQDSAFQATIREAALLRDIGSCCGNLQRSLQSGLAPETQRRLRQEHTRLGHAMLRGHPSPVIRMAADIALSHHERWDGNGYPRGTVGVATPLSGRIVHLAEALVLQIARQEAQIGIDADHAIDTLIACSAGIFDPQLLQAVGHLRDAIQRTLISIDPAAWQPTMPCHLN